MDRLVPGSVAPTRVIPAVAKDEKGFNTLVLLAFILVAGLASFDNQMWRDEVQAFLIARDSATPWEMVHNLRFDGHPILWYLLIWPGARLTWNPDSMKPVSVVVSIIGVSVFLWRGPFSRAEKIFWPFGYYVLFEYTVRSRSYGLGLMLLMIFCALWRTRERHLILMAFIMGLMANVHLYFGIMALACGLSILVRRLNQSSWRGLLRNPLRDFFAVLIFVVLALFGAYVAVPARHGAFALTNDLSVPSVITLGHLVFTLAHIGIPFSLLPSMGVSLLVTKWLAIISVISTVVLIHATWRMIRRSPSAVTFVASTTAMIIGVFCLVHPPSIYHVGLLLVVLVAGIWISRVDQDTEPDKLQSSSYPVLITLSCQAIMGVAVLGHNTFVPQAHGRDVAQWIIARGWSSDPVAAPGSWLTPVCGYLRKPECYHMDTGRWSSYLVYDRHFSRAVVSTSDLEHMVARTATLAPAVTALIPIGYPIDAAMMARHGFRHIVQFSGAIEDNYDVYRKQP